MRIDYVIPCRYAEVVSTGVTILGGGADRFDVTELPASVSLAVALRVVGAYDELAGHSFPVHCHVEGPDGESCGDPVDYIQSARDFPKAQRDRVVAVVSALTIRWVVAEEGVYTLHLRVDGLEHREPVDVALA